MITFEDITWKNFLSTGNKKTKLQLNKTKTTLIVGTNGSGKSTFLDALSFGLFGRPFRKIKLGQLVNSVNRKNMEVEVNFSIKSKEYKIVRGHAPNKFEIYIDGDLLNQEAKAKDMQDYLETHILKMNEKSFRQIVVLGAGSFVPFMRLSAGDRRSIIEELLDIQIFSTMNDLLKDRQRSVKEELSDVEYEIKLANHKINIVESHLEKLKDKSVEQVAQLEEEIEKVMGQVTDMNSDIATLQETITDKPLTEVKRDKFNAYITNFKSKRQQADGRVKFFTTHTSCPTCDQELTEDVCNDKANINGAKSTELTTAINDCNKHLQQASDRLGDINSVVANIVDKNNSITSSNNYIMKLQKDLAGIISSEEVTVDTAELDELHDGLNDAHKNKTSLARTKQHYNIITGLLKDTGIKTRIINQYLPIMNKLINKYLQALNFFINFNLDEEFNETIKSRGRDKFGYANFSEGEKLRIDLALLFTWREVAKLKNSTNCNLLILDEVFDSSLDTNGIDDFLGILNTLDDNNNAFIISHKGDSIVDKFGRLITMTKNQNFSTLTEN